MKLKDRITDKRCGPGRPPIHTEPEPERLRLTVDPITINLVTPGSDDTEEVNRRLRLIVADLKKIQ